MAEGADIGIPGFPVDQASDVLLRSAPVFGPIIIFLAAALVAGALLWMKTMGTKDRELADAKAAHIADLRTMIPAMQDLRESVRDTLAALSARGRRTP